jgi:hypothetical protein
MKRKEHPDNSDSNEQQKEKKARQGEHIQDIIGRCVPLSEYKLTERQLAKKFEGQGLGKAWMTILAEFCKHSVAGSVMLLARRSLRRCINNPLATWTPRLHKIFRKFAKNYYRTYIQGKKKIGRQDMLHRSIHTRGSGLSTALSNFAVALVDVIQPRTRFIVVTGNPTPSIVSDAFEFKTLEQVLKWKIKDRKNAHGLVFMDIPFFDPDTGEDLENQLVVCHPVNLGIMGFPCLGPTE